MAFLTMFMIVLIVGTATPTVAVGALFGSMAGAAYMTVVCVIARRE